MFSCLHFFLKTKHFQLSPFFSHIFSSQLSPPFSLPFSSLLFFSHIPFPPFFSNTFGCLRHSKKYSSPFFEHTFSSLPFFLSPRVAFAIQKNLYFSISLPFLNTLSLPSTFFPHLSVIYLLFSITLSLFSLLFPTLSVPLYTFTPSFFFNPLSIHSPSSH